jgi:hypothetical protein
MPKGTQRDWRELCAAVTKETDSTKLSSLVEELIEALDQDERAWRDAVPHLTQSKLMTTPSASGEGGSHG